MYTDVHLCAPLNISIRTHAHTHTHYEYTTTYLMCPFIFMYPWSSKHHVQSFMHIHTLVHHHSPYLFTCTHECRRCALLERQQYSWLLRIGTCTYYMFIHIIDYMLRCWHIHLSLSIHIYIYIIHIYIYICTSIALSLSLYIYIYIHTYTYICLVAQATLTFNIWYW